MPSLCPFCNAVLPALTASPAAGKLTCPRCGEPVPATRWHMDTAVKAGEPRTRPTLPEARPSIRKTLYVVLGIMLVMAVTSLSYALWSRPERRARDPWMPTKLTPVPFRQPIELPGLGYLPKGSQLVAAIQVAELVDDKEAGQPLLTEPRPSTLDWVLKQIAKTTGLKIEQLDHVVLATSLDAIPPQLTIVVQTRQPYSLKNIAVGGQPAKGYHREQPVFEVSLKPAGEALLWCVNERTLIFIARFDPPTFAHLQGLMTTPRPLDEVLPAPVRAAMTERLPKHNFLWAAGSLDQLGATKDWLPLLGGKADLGAVKDMKTFAIGIAPIEGLTLRGEFRMTDAKSAAKFQAMLADVKIAGAKSHKVVGPGDEAVAPWIGWQVRGDVAAMRAFLDRAK